MPAVALGEERRSCGDRPLDSEGGVVPEQAAVVLRRVIGADLVCHIRVWLERAVSMREAGGHEPLRPGFRIDGPRNGAAIARRAAAQIDSDAEDRTARHA